MENTQPKNTVIASEAKQPSGAASAIYDVPVPAAPGLVCFAALAMTGIFTSEMRSSPSYCWFASAQAGAALDQDDACGGVAFGAANPCAGAKAAPAGPLSPDATGPQPTCCVATR
jgi:hypothetical protein